MKHVRRPVVRLWPALGTVVAVVATLLVPAAPAFAGKEVRGTANPTAIKDSYIVVYNRTALSGRGVDAVTGDLAAKYGAKVDHVYRHALQGFAGALSEKAAQQLAAEPTVAYVQQNGRVRKTGTQPGPPSWGLDRIDQRDLPLDNSYTYPNTASNVTAYVIDTGIRVTHRDFGGRASWGTNTTGDGIDSDCNGHGTHVAGTIGGASYGVAKDVRLVAVKVLDCDGSGSFAGVAAGIDWVTGHHASGPAVANMSLGAPGSDDVTEDAVRGSIADGVTYAIAAGNEDDDACGYTPARVAEAITVDASDSADTRAWFSNYGACTDLFAPGVDITSAWNGSDSDSNTISGTSMATPHVTGGAALLLGTNPALSPAQVADAMITNATPGKITDPGTDSPNRLLNVTAAGVPGAPVVTNPGNRTGAVGAQVSLQLSATGGTSPYTWSATGLPGGLSIAPSTGVISGTLTTAGGFTVTATATDDGGRAGSTSFTWTVTPPGGCAGGQKLVNPGFESGSTGWSNATYTVGQWSGVNAARSGSWSAWLGGYGTDVTETLEQTVTIPAGCANSVLSLYLKIHTGEVGSTPYDRFTVRIGSTVLATYSNANASGYTVRSFDVGAFAGRTVTVSFTSSEDATVQTSFVLDDLSLTAA
ncbi:S8 family peptidase [Amycolatopsis sp. NPDC021455]|uniref:S8 family peptidase n=1 Tax=Amycolatopsis sp. NPDC021455 TaxID=3154901 RepID=UPI0033F834B0